MTFLDWLRLKLGPLPVAETASAPPFVFNINAEDAQDSTLVEQRRNEETFSIGEVLKEIEAGRTVSMEHALTAPHDPNYWTEDYAI